MENSIYQKTTASRTPEKSLEAYKVWIREIARRLTTQETEIKLTEEEWIANWKAFLKDKFNH